MGLKKNKKICFVPKCPNTSANSKLLFLVVPQNEERRRKWLAQINVRTYTKSFLNCCENHFNLEEDAENWMYFKTMGHKIILKKGVVPHRNLTSPSISLNSQLSLATQERKLTNLINFQTKSRCSTCAHKNISSIQQTSDSDANFINSSLSSSTVPSHFKHETKTQEVPQNVTKEACKDFKNELLPLLDEAIDIKEEIIELSEDLHSVGDISVKQEYELLNSVNIKHEDCHENKIEFVEVPNTSVTNFYNESVDIQTSNQSDLKIHKDYVIRKKVDSNKNVIKKKLVDIRCKPVPGENTGECEHCSDTLTCEHCSKTFTTSDDLETHLKSCCFKYGLTSVTPNLIPLPQPQFQLSQPQFVLAQSHYQLLFVDSPNTLFFQT